MANPDETPGSPQRPHPAQPGHTHPQPRQLTPTKRIGGSGLSRLSTQGTSSCQTGDRVVAKLRLD